MKAKEEWLRPKVVAWVLVVLIVTAFVFWPDFRSAIVQRMISTVTTGAMPLLGAMLALALAIAGVWLIICKLFKKK